MNFSKSLSIYDTHANSLFLGQLVDSGEKPKSELETVRGLQPYIRKIQTLLNDVNREYEICRNLQEEKKFYEDSYNRFKAEIVSFVENRSVDHVKKERVNKITEQNLKKAQIFLNKY